MGKIILLNGPPSSGKDTAAKHIRDAWHPIGYGHCSKQTFYKTALDRMSMPIKRAFAGTMGLPITPDGEVLRWEACKEEVIPEFGITYRQWQIEFSENFLKYYDNAIFGRLLAKRIQRLFSNNDANLVVVPDCGFQVEIEVLYSKFNPDDILLVRCHRHGCTFDGDSRGYVHAPQGCAYIAPINEDRDEYLKLIEGAVRCWLETPEKMPREE